jgi:hypothetical protein
MIPNSKVRNNTMTTANSTRAAPDSSDERLITTPNTQNRYSQRQQRSEKPNTITLPELATNSRAKPPPTM